jgi:acyl carrier protein
MPEEKCVIERVRELVVESLQLQIEPDQIDVDEPLFGGDATVDSMGSLEIIAALEGEYGFRVPDDDLRVELFDSIRSLAAYVMQRRETATAA